MPKINEEMLYYSTFFIMYGMEYNIKRSNPVKINCIRALSSFLDIDTSICFHGFPFCIFKYTFDKRVYWIMKKIEEK